MTQPQKFPREFQQDVATAKVSIVNNLHLVLPRYNDIVIYIVT